MINGYVCGIANSFNKYFVGVGPNLAKNTPLDSNSFAFYQTKTWHWD